MLRPVKNAGDYDKYLQRIYELIQKDLTNDSTEYEELELLSILVKDYEYKFQPMSGLNPLEAIRFRMNQLNISEKELLKILDARTRKVDLLSGKKKLSLGMIRRLHDNLKIPYEILIKDY
jgi:HTH-type transcriptional regulator/antitoxin HigA